MIFETLDSIDWLTIEVAVYAEPHQIPSNIRQLLSPNPQERYLALGFLFGDGENYGAVNPSTAYIIPFALEVIADPTQAARVPLLERFAVMTKHKIHTVYGRDYTVGEMRCYVAAYDALEQGIPVYTELLTAPDATVRAASALVLGGLSASAESILPVLRDHFKVETVESVQIAIVEAMARLLHELEPKWFELRQTYASFFQEIIERVRSPALRFIAAKSSIMASASQGFGLHLKDKEVTPALISALTEHYWALQDDRDRPYKRLEIAQLLALLPNLTPLITLLNDPATTPSEAHSIVRAMLSHYLVESALRQYWACYPLYDPEDKKRIYEIYGTSTYLNLYQSYRQTHKGGLWDVLRSIADSDKFWLIQSNLLSSMFNLPDEREQLRIFIERTD